MKRDPELASLLARALPRGEPRPGAEERVLAKLRLREDPSAPRVPRSRAPGWWLAAAVLLSALIGVGNVIYALGRDATEARLGSFESVEQASAPRRVDVGTHDELLRLRSDVRVLARAHSKAELAESAEGISYRLEAGEVLVHVPSGQGLRFEVVTATARVLVQGTVFGVRAAPDASTSVTVWEGKVEVRRAEVRTSVGSGQHWPPEAAALPLSESDLQRLAATERVRAPSSVDDTEQTDVGAASPALRATPRREPRVRSSYLRARDLELEGERRRAAALYERAAEAGGPSAEAALFAAARLYAGLAEHATAERLILAYRQRHVDGEYARAADVLLLRGYVAQGAAKKIEREATRFITRYPADPRAIQFRWARARQWAESGRCAEARAELPELGLKYATRLAEWCPRPSGSDVGY